MRQTTTEIDNVSESTVSYFLTEAKDVSLFEEWIGTTRLQILRTRHPQGYTWVQGRQQGFIDERASLDISTVADPSRSADDEQDDEMSEPTQMTRAEKRKADESAKALRASLPIAASSHASLLRLDDETQEQLVRSAEQARTTKTGVETPQDVSYLCQKGHCEHLRNGFLQVRMAGMRQSNKKKLLKKKDGERNLHFPSCPPEVQAALRETRRGKSG